MPKAVGNYVDLMAATIGPAALFSLGLSLIERKLRGNIGEVIWLSALAAVFNPLLALAPVTYVFAMDPFWSKAVVILSAMPTGANAYGLPSNTMFTSRPHHRWSSYQLESISVLLI